MPRSTMKVALIRHTLLPEEVVALGARLCYSRATVDSLQQRVSRDDQSEFVSRILSMGHESVLEHASFTFAMEGVSRVLLAQITRHRLASFSVQSQRYVSYEKGFGYIVPPKIEALGEDAVAEFERQMDTMHQWYTGWQEKLGAGEGGGRLRGVAGQGDARGRHLLRGGFAKHGVTRRAGAGLHVAARRHGNRQRPVRQPQRLCQPCHHRAFGGRFGAQAVIDAQHMGVGAKGIRRQRHQRQRIRAT